MSATFNRVANIKLLPDFWRPRGSGKRGVSKREPKRYEVAEILLEDVCICVDSGVWNDLLGDHVGAAFSPQFCLEVKVGPKASTYRTRSPCKDFLDLPISTSLKP